jgi:hypothetical protein
MNNESYPAGWNEFVSSLKLKGEVPLRPIAAWAARFRVAKSLSGITLDGMSETAESGYFIGLKLTLVDTALEALEHAIGAEAGSTSFHDSAISAQIWRERSGELTSAFKSLTNRKLHQELSVFLTADEESSQEFDLRVVLRAFRHLTAHGDFNPSASGLYTSAGFRMLLLALADAGLRRCEERFIEHFELGPADDDEQVDYGPAGVEVVFDLSGEDPDSPGMKHLSTLLQQDRLAKEAAFEERFKAEALEEVAKNAEGLALFRERTASLSLEVITAHEIDEGSSNDAWNKVAREHELSSETLAITYVLGPPEEMLRLEKNPDLRADDEFLKNLRSHCLLFVMPKSLLFANKYEWTAQAFGVLLKRTNFNEQKALNGWDVGRTPILGNHPSIPTVVDEELLALPYLWSPAGSGNHYFSIAPQQLLEITNGKPGPRSRQYL